MPTKPLKILLLNQTFYPDSVATAQQLTDLALYLKDLGHEVSVLTGRRGYEQRDVLHEKFELWKGIKIYRAGSTGFGKVSFFHRLVDAMTFDLSIVWHLLKIPRQNLTVSFTSPPLVGVLGTLFCILKGGRSAQWLMDVNPDAAMAVGYIKEKSFVGRFLTFAFEFSLKKSQHVVVLDRWMKARAVAHGTIEERIAIVPPWPAHGQKNPGTNMPKENDFRKTHGLSGKFIVLYSGNHSVVHPLDTLLGAAKELRNDSNVVFLFIGGGLRVPEVKAFQEKHQLDNIVQLKHQPREMLSQSLSCPDAHVVVMGPKMSGLVHTSKVYGILATGRPYLFIGPRQSHLGDLLNDIPGGFHAEHDDVKGVVDAIRKLQGLTDAKLESIREMNQRFVAQQGLEGSMKVFTRDVLGVEPAASSGDPELARSATR